MVLLRDMMLAQSISVETQARKKDYYAARDTRKVMKGEFLAGSAVHEIPRPHPIAMPT
jgi:hypothetical protein